MSRLSPNPLLTLFVRGAQDYKTRIRQLVGGLRLDSRPGQNRRAFLWLLFFTLGWLLCRREAHADSSLNLKTPPVPVANPYQRPEDLISLIPFLGEIPRSFLLGDGYQMKLSGTELRIDHMGLHSRAPQKKRDCMIGISYIRPVAGFFTSRIDLPLLFSPTPDVDQWSMNSLGDYVAYFSKGAEGGNILRLAISARF